MIGLELKEAGAGARLMDELRKFGVITLASRKKGQGISLTPALNIPESQLFAVVGSISQALQRL